MHVLFIHQNFPAQFRFIAPRLAEHGWRCSFITERKEHELPGVEKILYKPRGGATPANHFCTRNFENAVAHCHGVYDALKARRDLNPDLVIAHSGFGSSLFVPFLTDAPIINFFEFFYAASGQDLGFRPEIPVDEPAILRSTTNNAMILLDAINCDRGWVATGYQRDFFPPELRSKIEVIFDGIDTSVYFRKPDAPARVRASWKIPDDHRIVTYAARGFEMMRGFDIFMKAAKHIYERHDKVTFVVVGTDRIHYGGDQKYIKEKSFRHHVLAQDNYDLERFRFTGFLQPEILADVLSAGDAHIYLTEPFIASWSMVNAMACGAVVVASDQNCVREYIAPGQNGLLENFFDDEAIAARVLEILRDPPAFKNISESAVATVKEKYSLDVALPRLIEFFQKTSATKRQPSVLIENLLRAGTLSPIHPELGGAASDTVLSLEIEPTLQNVDGNELELATAEIKRLSAIEHSAANWPRIVQTYAGPPGALQTIGPPNHPVDLARMLQRLGEWNALNLLDLGATDIGIIFLWTRMASPTARIIVAELADRPLDLAKVPLLNALPRAKQRIFRLAGAANFQALEDELAKTLEGKKLDFVFMHGRRPYEALAADFRRLRKFVRPGGLVAWDGINPMTRSPDTEGGDKLWQELRPLYPQRAEYLTGTVTEAGGIAMIKL